MGAVSLPRLWHRLAGSLALALAALSTLTGGSILLDAGCGGFPVVQRPARPFQDCEVAVAAVADRRVQMADNVLPWFGAGFRRQSF